MSRGEELRKKLAAKVAANPFDEQKADFTISLDAVLVSEKNAKATSKTFVDRLYAEFIAEKPVDVQAWIRQKVSGLFLYVSKQPVWVDEPSWCLENGTPLEFLHQFEDEEGVNFYVFRGYREAIIAGIAGKVRYLRLVAQDHKGIIHLDGDIVG
jgi:hypothetical protein